MKFFLITLTLIFLNGSFENGFPDENQKYTHPFVFTEQGIEFLVFPEGQIELNIPPASVKMGDKKITEVYLPENGSFPYRNQQQYRKGYVKYNRLGQPVQAGPVQIEYGKNGKVVRIDDIKLTYIDGRLDRVGDLKVEYDRNGQIKKYTGRISEVREVPGLHRNRR